MEKINFTLLFICITNLFLTLSAQNVNIPDVNFKKVLVSNLKINTNGDNEIQVSEATNFAGELKVYNKDIASLVGIEAFPSLTNLDCSYNKLSNIDLKNNINLKNLNCGSNYLSNIDLTNNISLDTLFLYDLSLTSLDLRNNKNLKNLNTSHSYSLHSIDLSQCTALVSLYCSNNALLTLDLSNNKLLTDLYCSENGLTSLDLSNNKDLTFINCSENRLTSLNLSNNTVLTYLNCDGNKLNSLNLSNNKLLTDLYCSDNLLTNIDLSNNSILSILYCHDNQLANIDISNDTALTFLICSGNQLTSLDLSKNIALIHLDCSGYYMNNYTDFCNQITSLDLSNNKALEILWCTSNQLISLNVKNGNNTNLEQFTAGGNYNLKCIEVDNVTWSLNHWGTVTNGINSKASYSTDCNYNSVGINSQSNIISLNDKTQIFPNPFVNETTLISPTDIDDNYSLSITNLQGLLMKQYFNINEKIIIKKDNMESGLYFFTLIGQNSGRIYKGKFIIK